MKINNKKIIVGFLIRISFVLILSVISFYFGYKDGKKYTDNNLLNMIRNESNSFFKGNLMTVYAAHVDDSDVDIFLLLYPWLDKKTELDKLDENSYFTNFYYYTPSTNYFNNDIIYPPKRSQNYL